ncbi:hypothetical protein AAEO50_02075 [Rossellomorea oryzaecorticis]|uniref:Uncharacterized protein n=1 Tax=Rossellomorea oryzaecorticis TaxID=1396505 RepID=A0ABU9K4W8_9BACI
MNGYLMEILARDIVKSLPSRKRDMYQYVVRREDELARQATTSDEFMSLLIRHAPHRQAAEHFHLSFGEFMAEMREIEKEIDRQLSRKLQQVRWVDCTDVMQRGVPESLDKKYFYFSVGVGSVPR